MNWHLEFGPEPRKARDPDPPTDTLTPAKRPTPALAPAPPPVPAARHPPPLPATPEEVDDNEEPLVHPFSRAKDAAYAP